MPHIFLGVVACKFDQFADKAQDLISSLKAHSFPSWKPLIIVSAPTSRVIVNTKYLTNVQAALEKCNLKHFVLAVMCNRRLALSASAFADDLYPLLHVSFVTGDRYVKQKLLGCSGNEV